jgi:hypothetical protein
MQAEKALKVLAQEAPSQVVAAARYADFRRRSALH